MAQTNNPHGIYLASKGLLGPFQTLATKGYLTTVEVREPGIPDLTDCVWGGIEFLWGEIDYLWDSIIPCFGRIISASGGGHPDDVYNIYQKKKIDKKTKKKIIKLIMTLKGQEFIEEHEIDVDKYEVTVDDIKLLIGEYKEYQKRQKQVSVSVESVGIRM